MSKVYGRDRRHFLVGAGGVLVGIPFLTSVAPRRARGQQSKQLRLVILGTDHGGVHAENFYPVTASPQSQSLYPALGEAPAHSIQWSPLSLQRQNGRARLSNVLEAADGAWSDDLLTRMNVIGGVDITTYIGHNRASFTGNFAGNDQGEDLHDLPVATIDQVVAGHEPFNLSRPRERSMNFGIGYGVSSSIRHSASLERRNGQVVPVQATGDPGDLWRRLFEGTDSGSASSRTPVVDLVHEHYRRLTTGAFGDARRLSQTDRQRLEAHMTLLSELQRKIGVNVDCGSVPRPNAGDDIDRLRVAADLYVAALRCGASHVGVMTTALRGISDQSGWNNWHEQVAHNGGGDRSRPDYNPNFQRINYLANRRFFEEVFLRIADGLNVEEADGETYLDRSLVMWSNESGDQTHGNVSMPIVTAGSAGGFFHTGRYIDYRNYANRRFVEDSSPDSYPGVLLNRFLANVLQGMGVPPSIYHQEMMAVQPSEFAEGYRGYGVASYHEQNFWSGNNLRTQIWPDRHYRDGDELLPLWAVGA
ncbi:MAG: DUF1552 domain-containing protein [Myxococcota bacterium]